MTSATPSTSWSNRKWIAVIGGIFVFQTIIIGLISRTETHKSDRHPPHRSGIVLLSTVTNTDPIFELVAMVDPANTALVNSNCYTGRLWFQPHSPDANWPELFGTHHWLHPDQIRDLTVPYTQLQKPALPSPEVVASQPLIPKPAPVATKQMLTSSVLRAEGELQNRTILDRPVLPTWEFSDVLYPTTVQIVLDEHGHVISATLLGRSGLPAADEKAIEIAKGLTFKPSAEAAKKYVEWGILTFIWATREPIVQPQPLPTAGAPSS